MKEIYGKKKEKWHSQNHDMMKMNEKKYIYVQKKNKWINKIKKKGGGWVRQIK